MANFLKLLHDLILSQDDTTLDEDNFLFASSISQALHQVCTFKIFMASMNWKEFFCLGITGKSCGTDSWKFQ